MKKLITTLAVILAVNISAQSTITPTIKYSHFGGINYKADHEIDQFDLGFQNVTDKQYWLFDEGHTSIKAIQIIPQSTITVNNEFNHKKNKTL